MKRIDFIKSLGLLGLISCEEEEMNRQFLSYYYYQNGGINLSQYFTELNLQSDDAANFTLSGTKVSQWNDLSGNNRHAKQGTDSRRPLYNSGSILFDGTDDRLELDAQFQLSTFSFYAVVKSTDLSTKHFISGTSAGYIGKNTGRTQRLSGVSELIGYKTFGDEFYQVISFRKSPTLHSYKINKRWCRRVLGTPVDSLYNFRYLGTRSLGDFWNGTIRAIGICPDYLSDADDDRIVDALFTKYNLPETSNCIVGFGDSITEGTGATDQYSTAWLPSLATLKSVGYKNYGISGTPLSNVASFSGNGQDRWDTQLVEPPYSDTVCILYGTNDITLGGSYTSTTFETALSEVLTGLIAAGYSRSKICVGTVPYRQGDALASTIAQYNTKITDLSTSFGILQPADVYASMKAVGDSCMSDTVHPNNTGHQIIRDAFNARIP